MYYTFDTRQLSDTDFSKFSSLRGFCVRHSYGKGEHNRGMLILADGLIFKDMDAVKRALPKGYEITDSELENSAGCIQAVTESPHAGAGSEETKLIAEVPAQEAGTDRADAVRRTIASRGAAAGLSLLSDFTVLGILTKSTEILPLLQEILAAAAADDYASCNILDIYKTIPKLRIMYWDDEEKRDHLQQQFDRLCSGACRLSDIKNPYDALYQKGLAALLHIHIRS